MNTTTPATTGTNRPSHETGAVTGIAPLFSWITSLLTRIPDALVQLFARLSIAPVFWLSGQTKVDGWSIKDTTFYLFRYEYQVPVLPPDLAAYMATAAEHFLPVLLVIGLATRFAALGLLGMTLVIQVFVYPEAWSLHALWVAVLLVIAARGPGTWSLDHLIGRRIGGPR
ncbi:MAG: DoxX family protein [Rhodospirillales bacterium]|nr:DoxX family protein [Rhodospirillales bacterium]